MEPITPTFAPAPQALKSRSSSASNSYIQDTHKAAYDSDAFALTYRAAYDMFLRSGLTTRDILTLKDKFWQAHLDGSCAFDTAATTIFSIHSNLCMGTLAPYARKQTNIHNLLAQLERFEICGDFMLTEIGHGLDARNIETTATLSNDGKSFDLHTPSLAAAKSMPPTTPLGGVPKVAVVFAQLLVDGRTQGVRTFVVRLTNGTNMCRGISTTLLPQRPGNRALDHAITTFNHVRLDRADLLGELDSAGDKRQSFLSQIHRVSVGGLALSLVNIPASKAGAYLCYSFSKNRTVIDATTAKPVSILTFPTQYGPIISAVAHAVVMESAARFFIGIYQTKGVPEMLRQALVCIFKATTTYSTQRHLSDLTDRCGWRGLFAHNKIAEMQLGLKGNSIAEGDIMVLCIRLASELLQSKHALPASSTPTSPLARHEQGLMTFLRTSLKPENSNTSSHRSSLFAQNVTPRAVDLIQAIGHRFAYDSAKNDSSIRQELVDVWEADCMLQDAGWYIEHAGLTNAELHSRRVGAIERALPYLEGVIGEWGMDKWFGNIPVTSGAAEEEFLRRLPTFESREMMGKLGSML